MRTQPLARGARAGFTLTEIMAVIVILGILSAFLYQALGSSNEVVKAKLTRARLAEIETVVLGYERRFGDFPPSELPAADGGIPNDLNRGIEALVASLWSQGYEAGGGISSDDLVNFDGDRSTKALTDLPDRQLFELVDAWDNPLAYFRSDAYGREHAYLVIDAEQNAEVQSIARAVKNPTTGRWFQHGRFQLLSAGEDGSFGTEDDVANFDLPRE